MLTEKAKLTASDIAIGSNARFGESVYIDGETVVVGAYNVNSAQGSAYVFLKGSGDWSGTRTENAKLLASDGGAGDEFGGSVAIRGDLIAVGAYHNDGGKGAAYVFEKPQSG